MGKNEYFYLYPRVGRYEVGFGEGGKGEAKLSAMKSDLVSVANTPPSAPSILVMSGTNRHNAGTW